MNIKRFEAKNMGSALEMVKAELGEEAIILSTGRRRKRDSATQEFVNTVELVAAVDFDHRQVQEDDTAPKDRGGAVEDLHDLCPPRQRSRESAGPEQLDSLNREIQDLKRLLSQALIRPAAEVADPVSHSFLGQGSPLLIIQQVFTELGMEPTLQQALAARFLAEMGTERSVTYGAVAAWLGEYGLSHIKTGVRAGEAKGPCWWALLGPTGVGKTTTMAKLAAQLKFKKGMKGVLITVDTYRLGAIEQISKYSELMDIPLETARDAKQLIKIFARHKEKDFILVDTTGRSPGDPRHGQELSRIFDAVPGLGAQAILCATAKSEDLMASIRCYSRFPVVGWIISKIDETSSYGTLCSPVLGRELPISYITNGQKVPEDIQPASRERLSELLLSRIRKEAPQQPLLSWGQGRFFRAIGLKKDKLTAGEHL
jgi:flagellar biosynthesis protein FlhF